LINTLKQFTSSALDLVFPPSCVHCGREGALLCQGCIAESTLVGTDVCRKCAEPLSKAGLCSRCVAEEPSIDRLYGSYLYETPVGSAIRAFKFNDVRALSGTLGELFDIGRLERADIDLVSAIPMHKSRLRSRGYNQSEILGRKLSDRLEVRFQSGLMVRSRNAPPQSEQPTAIDRRAVAIGAFSVKSSLKYRIEGKRVLLVDDVFTTGSTIEAAAVALKSAGASWVGAAALTVQPIGSLK
jgi:competence protein ComFC